MKLHCLIILATAINFSSACTKKNKKKSGEDQATLEGVNEDYVAFRYQDLEGFSKGQKLTYKIHFKQSHAFGDIRMLEEEGYAPLKRLKDKFPGEKGNIRISLFNGENLIAEAAHENIDFATGEGNQIKIMLKECQLLAPWDGKSLRGGCQYDINSK